MTAILNHEDLYREILDSLLEHTALLDAAGTILLTNRAWDRFARENGDPEMRHTGAGINYLEVCRRAVALDPTLAPVLQGLTDLLAGRRDRYILEYPCHSPYERRWFLMHATQLGGIAGRAVVHHINITRRKLAEEEQALLVAQLEDALANLKTLGGLLPICSGCKKIRDDRGYWTNIETYITEHSGTMFTHGLCPDCLAKYAEDPDKNNDG